MATPLGASGLGVGLTFAPGRLYRRMDRDPGSLRRIDPATGAPRAAIPLSGGVGRPIGALAADPRGGLPPGARVNHHGGPRPADLIAIDPASGALTVRGARLNQLAALAYAGFP